MCSDHEIQLSVWGPTIIRCSIVSLVIAGARSPVARTGLSICGSPVRPPVSPSYRVGKLDETLPYHDAAAESYTPYSPLV